jgi:3-methylfumaryl-CoA hydratase
MDIDHLKSWIGRQETLHDTATLFPAAALSATLDRDDPPPAAGDALPPLWHWLYFLPTARQSQLGPDGHPKRGGFLPPVKLPRRMWAGGRFAFLQPLRLGEAITRVSTIKNVSMKQGRTGPLIFVVVRHEVSGADGLALTEEHDIVYREAAAPGEREATAPGEREAAAPGEAPPAPHMAPATATWRRDIAPDDVLLFRYSALTFNGHRIHYDRRYVTTEEGYPGLIVHGPLLATLLLDLLRRNHDGVLKFFKFRALSPTFDTTPFAVCGQPGADGAVSLWAQHQTGVLAMQAEATLG